MEQEANLSAAAALSYDFYTATITWKSVKKTTGRSRYFTGL